MISFKRKLSTYFCFLVNRFGFLVAELKQAYRTKPCLLCLASTENQYGICQQCLADLPLNTHHCMRCALPLANSRHQTEHDSLRHSAMICGECIADTPPFTITIAPFHYDYPINSCIHLLKYNGRRYIAQRLSNFLAEDILHHYNNDPLPEVLIPVPLHKKKQRKRYFNQSELIAKAAGKKLKLSVDSSVLKKIKNTQSQANLNKQQRKRNLRQAFQIKSNHAYKHVALVDDVMTTRATSEVLAKLLIQSGVERVDIWCIARTPKHRN